MRILFYYDDTIHYHDDILYILSDLMIVTIVQLTNDHFDKQIFDILNIPLNKNNVTVAHEFIKNHPNDLDWDIIKIK